MFKFFTGFALAALLAVLSPPKPTLADDPQIQKVMALMAAMHLKINEPPKDEIAQLIERNR